MFDIKEYSAQKAEELSFFRDLTPSFQVIFHVICFFGTNEGVTENLLIAKVWKFLKKNYMMEFLSVKLDAYSVQTSILL